MKMLVEKKSAGQAVLIILLIMAVVLTIGLAVVSRSITDIKISTQEEESARALSVAEAGIEEALKLGYAPPGGIEVGGVTAFVTEETQGRGSDFDFGKQLFKEGATQTLWLIEHTDGELKGESFPVDGTIRICWGDNPENKTAVEVALLYKDQGDGKFKLGRGGYDADLSRAEENGFDSADDMDGGNCGNLAFAKDIDLKREFDTPLDATLYALRIKLLYNLEPQPLAVSSLTEGASFPSQGKCYVSTATIQESGVTRRVRQCQSYKAPPTIFDYVLFSEEDLVK